MKKILILELLTIDNCFWYSVHYLNYLYGPSASWTTPISLAFNTSCHSPGCIEKAYHIHVHTHTHPSEILLICESVVYQYCLLHSSVLEEVDVVTDGQMLFTEFSVLLYNYVKCHLAFSCSVLITRGSSVSVISALWLCCFLSIKL